jgi:ketosteroid isomerase-like protein
MNMRSLLVGPHKQTRDSLAGSSRSSSRRAAAWSLVLAMALSLWGGNVAAQNQKKNKKDKQQTQAADTSPVLPDSQAIDQLISEMLGAWQIGDVDLMHKHYSDDVTMVSGAWEQPLFGWDNYVKAYLAQRARVQAGRMDRINTYTKVTGDAAWSTYQWEFAGQVDGKPLDILGHTTLALEKRNGAWIIVMNHTSVVSTSTPAAPTAVDPAKSAVPKA